MSDYDDLKTALPEYVNLHDLTGIIAETFGCERCGALLAQTESGALVDQRGETTCTDPLDDDSPAQPHVWTWPDADDERESLAALIDGLDGAGVDIADVSRHGGTLVSADGWVDYCRDLAEDVGYTGSDRQDNPLLAYVDWNAWADAVRMDYTELDVETGDFAGTWLYRD